MNSSSPNQFNQISIADRMLQQLQAQYQQCHKYNIENNNISKNYLLQQKENQAQQIDRQGYEALQMPSSQDEYQSNQSQNSNQQKIKQQFNQENISEKQGSINTQIQLNHQHSQEIQDPIHLHLKTNPEQSQFKQQELFQVQPVPQSVYKIPQHQFQIDQDKIKQLSKAMNIEIPAWMMDQKSLMEKINKVFNKN